MFGLLTFPEMHVKVAGKYRLEFQIDDAVTVENAEFKIVSSAHALHVVHGHRHKIQVLHTSGLTEGKTKDVLPILPMQLKLSDEYDNPITNSSCLEVSVQLFESLLIQSGLWGISLVPATAVNQGELCQTVPKSYGIHNATATMPDGQAVYETCDGSKIDVDAAELDSWPGPCSITVATSGGMAVLNNVTTSLADSKSAYPLKLDLISGCSFCKGQA